MSKLKFMFNPGTVIALLTLVMLTFFMTIPNGYSRDKDGNPENAQEIINSEKDKAKQPDLWISDPNPDSPQDLAEKNCTVKINNIYKRGWKITAVFMRITDSAGNIVYGEFMKKPNEASIAWDGRNKDGYFVNAHMIYRAVVEVHYGNGKYDRISGTISFGKDHVFPEEKVIQAPEHVIKERASVITNPTTTTTKPPEGVGAIYQIIRNSDGLNFIGKVTAIFGETWIVKPALKLLPGKSDPTFSKLTDRTIWEKWTSVDSVDISTSASSQKKVTIPQSTLDKLNAEFGPGYF